MYVRKVSVGATKWVTIVLILAGLVVVVWGLTAPPPDNMTVNITGRIFAIMGGIWSFLLLVTLPFSLWQAKRQREYYDVLEELRQQKRKKP